jgi:hypothetical protein
LNLARLVFRDTKNARIPHEAPARKLELRTDKLQELAERHSGYLKFRGCPRVRGNLIGSEGRPPQ